MMKILNAQMSAFHARMEADFVEQAAQHLREHHAALVAHLPADVLLRRVRFALARGRSHGFTWQSALVGFVELMFTVAPDFDRHHAFRYALRIRPPDENDRILAIYQNTTEEHWDEAKESTAPDAWDDAREA